MKLSRRSKVAWITGVLAGLAACGGDGDDAANRADASCDACVAADAGKSDGSATADDAASEADAGGMDAGDGMQAVTIRFKAKLGDRDLVCGQYYAGQEQRQGQRSGHGSPRRDRGGTITVVRKSKSPPGEPGGLGWRATSYFFTGCSTGGGGGSVGSGG